MEQITGRATHQITAVAGGVPEDYYVDLRIRQGLRESAPVVEGDVALAGESFTLLGVDPFAETPFRHFSGGLPKRSLAAFLTHADRLLLGRVSAGRLGLEVGDPVTLGVGPKRWKMQIAGFLDGPNPAALDGLVVADIAVAQELLEREGVLDRIDLVLSRDRAERLAADLPPNLRLESTASRTEATAQLSRAFHTNLAAMGLLALLVGALLIYNTMTFSVLQRRALLANLRTLGVTRRELFRLVMGEALLLGAAGTLAGIGMGIALAHSLLGLVTRTINDLYYTVTLSGLMIEPGTLVKGSLLGLAATLAATAGPALEATRSQPRAALRRSSIEQRVHRTVPWLAVAGGLLALAGWWLAQSTGRDLTLGFVALFLIIVGYTLLVPSLVLLLTRLLLPPLRALFGSIGGLAARGVGAGLSRSGVAVAALTVAVAATVGMGIMVTSFRATVDGWLDLTLQGDLYISSPQPGSGGGEGLLDPAVLERVRNTAGVRDLSTGRRIEIDSGRGPVDLLAIGTTGATHRGLRFRDEPLPDVWEGLRAGELLLISEPFAYHQRLEVGDSLIVYAAGGPQPFQVGGIFQDYGSDRGLLIMDRSVFQERWRDPGITAIGLFLENPEQSAQVLAEVRRALGDLEQPARVRSSREIRQLSLEIFDRTFSVTRVLRLISLGVAFVGIFSALMAMLLEGAREHAVLRATGVTRGQLLGLALLQTGLMGLMAGLLALPLGLAMATMLIEVINLRSFGWTLDTVFPPGVGAEALTLALLAALLAGLYPARRIARSEPAAALREE
jgi:putative ABC transport system permease protein